MAKINPIQTRFSAGELSPRFLAQSDTEGYKAGLAECTNFIVTRQGPIHRRGGFEHVKGLAGELARVFPFQLDPSDTPGEAFPIVVSDVGKILVFGGSVDVTGPNRIQNGDFTESDMRPWSWVVADLYSGSIFWDSGAARIQPDNDPDDYLGLRQLTTVPAGDVTADFRITVKTRDPLGGADLSNYGSFRYPAIKIKVGTTSGAGDIYESDWVENLIELSDVFNPSGNVAMYVTVLTKGGDYSAIPPTPGASPSDPYTPGVYGVLYRDIDSVVMNKVSTGGDYIELTHAFDRDDILGLSTYMHPNLKIMYMLCAGKTPRQLRHDGTTWVLEDVAFTAKPVSWVAESYPTALTFSGGRAWWGGVRGKPNTVWGSKSGSANYNNITLGSAADDAMEIEMTRRGLIRWLSGDKNLLIGTATTEYIITADGGVIIPGDFQVDPQSANGSRYAQPVSIGNSVLYISTDGRKIYSADYKWTDQAWSSRDLTFASEHLTNKNTATGMALCKNPEGLIWTVTDKGQLLCCTYEPFTGQMGWHRHITDGSVISICSLEKDGKSELYATVLRDNGMGGRSCRLERYREDRSLDACYRRSGITKVGTITGLSHLIGKTVGVLVDGATHPNKVVDETGSIVLQSSGNVVEVGLNFTAKMKTLPADWGSAAGSAAPMKKRWVKIGVRLLDSVYPKINGIRPPTRNPSTPMGVRDPNINVDAIVFGGGFDQYGQLTVEQDLPLPCTITGVFGELDQNQL